MRQKLQVGETVGRLTVLAPGADTLGIPVQRVQVRRRKGWPVDKILAKDNFKGANKNGRITGKS